MNLISKLLYLSVFFFAFISCQNTVSDDGEGLSLIPQPSAVKVEGHNGFEWNNSANIVYTDNDEKIESVAHYLGTILSNAAGGDIEVAKGEKDAKNGIVLSLCDTISGSESYHLNVGIDRVTISAKEPAGLFYGVQTLLQMLPSEVYVKGGLKNNFRLPATKISDSPRFAYRGLHLDVSRNFFTKDEVKKYIDLMAMLKFNRFHWHLTDGTGWRLEIKKYPLLTQKAAFRAEASWKSFWNGSRKFVDEGTAGAYGGYYTHDDVKEIVAYAAERYITIIPEIEMPGHSEEVFVAYPQLSCSGKPYINSDFCAGNDATFTFLEDVLSEVIDLFPSEYIHVGGDEAGKSAWKTCPKCQKRIHTENLKNVDELQSYFITRIGNFLTSKNRKMVGWDEILEGGLAPGATVMVWRGHEKATETALLKHSIIMTPGSHYYFDFYQADPATEPEAIGGYTTLERVYTFDPVVNDTVAPYILGGQANLWAEYVPDFKHVEYMIYPRAIALSEVLWSGKNQRDWDSFKKRLPHYLERLDFLDVNYHKPSYELQIKQQVDTLKKCINLTLESEQYRPVIRYTLDGSDPTLDSPQYSETISINEPAMLTAAIFVDNVPQQPFLKRDLGYHKGIGKKVIYNTKWTSYPAGGETALVDGLIGGLTYGDQLWQGFIHDLDVTVDMGMVESFNSFSARFMQLIGPDVYMPEYVEVSVSADGQNFEKVIRIDNDLSPKYDRLSIRPFSGSVDNCQARYIRVFAKNQKGFLFVDELIID